MARVNERETLHSLTFQIEDLPPEARVGVELSRFLPRAQISLQRSSAALAISAQYPNTPWTIRNLRLLPKRVELDLLASPEVLTLQLLVTADEPFLFGQLNVPAGARTTIVSPVETLRLYGPGYWVVPVLEPTLSQRGGRTADFADLAPPPQTPAPSRPLTRVAPKSIATPASKISKPSAAPAVSSRSNDDTREARA